MSWTPHQSKRLGTTGQGPATAAIAGARRMVRSVQPQSAVGVDWSHPLAPKRGFIVAQVNGALVMFTKAGAGVLSIGTVQRIIKSGVGFGAVGATSVVNAPIAAQVGADGFTVAWSASVPTASAVADRIFDTSFGGNLVSWVPASSGYQLSVSVTGGAVGVVAPSDPTSATAQCAAYDGSSVVAGSTAHVNWWIGGKQVSGLTNISPAISGTPWTLGGGIYLANRVDALRPFTGGIAVLYFDSYKRDANVCSAISSNPYQIFLPDTQKVWVPA